MSSTPIIINVKNSDLVTLLGILRTVFHSQNVFSAEEARFSNEFYNTILVEGGLEEKVTYEGRVGDVKII